MVHANTRHLLLIDDEREIFVSALLATGLPYEFTFVSEAEHVLDQLSFLLPDVIFIDFNMPKMNGIECLKAIKKFFGDRLVPLIIYSTNIEDIKMEALVVGAADCLKKTNAIIYLSAFLKKYLV